MNTYTLVLSIIICLLSFLDETCMKNVNNFPIAKGQPPA